MIDEWKKKMKELVKKSTGVETESNEVLKMKKELAENYFRDEEFSLLSKKGRIELIDEHLSSAVNEGRITNKDAFVIMEQYVNAEDDKYDLPEIQEMYGPNDSGNVEELKIQIEQTIDDIKTSLIAIKDGAVLVETLENLQSMLSHLKRIESPEELKESGTKKLLDEIIAEIEGLEATGLSRVESAHKAAEHWVGNEDPEEIEHWVDTVLGYMERGDNEEEITEMLTAIRRGSTLPDGITHDEVRKATADPKNRGKSKQDIINQVAAKKRLNKKPKLGGTVTAKLNEIETEIEEMAVGGGTSAAGLGATGGVYKAKIGTSPVSRNQKKKKKSKR